MPPSWPACRWRSGCGGALPPPQGPAVTVEPVESHLRVRDVQALRPTPEVSEPSEASNWQASTESPAAGQTDRTSEAPADAAASTVVGVRARLVSAYQGLAGRLMKILDRTESVEQAESRDESSKRG